MASTLENTLQQITKTLTSPCFSLGSPIHSSMACPVMAHRSKISSCQDLMLILATLPYTYYHLESVLSTKNPSPIVSPALSDDEQFDNDNDNFLAIPPNS